MKKKVQTKVTKKIIKKVNKKDIITGDRPHYIWQDEGLMREIERKEAHDEMYGEEFI